MVLRVGDRIGIDLDLKLGNASEAVQISEATPLLQANRGTASFVVEQHKVVTLPLAATSFP